MKNIKIIDRDELEEKLLNSSWLIVDLLGLLWQEAEKQYKLHGEMPDEADPEWSQYIKDGKWIDLGKMQAYDDCLEEYFDKTQMTEFMDNMEKKILKEIFEYLVKDSDD